MLNLDNIYTYHAPKPGQPECYEAIRSKAKELAELIAEVCPESREKSLANTRLEEAVMWANASIARNDKEETTVHDSDSDDLLLQITPDREVLRVNSSAFKKVEILPTL